MKQRISSCSSTIAISLLLLLFTVQPVVAQQQHPNPTPKRDQVKKEEPKEVVPLYCGSFLGVDVLGAGSYLLGGDFLSTELNFGVLLKNKYIPTVEVGYGKTDTWGESTGINYKAAAPYFRIGMDYNMMSKKKDKSSFLYLGARYGISSFTYDVIDAPVFDPIWGDTYVPALNDPIWGGSLNFDHTGMKATVQWLELVCGVNVQIYKNFHMGWSVRYKSKLSASISEYGDPWYVPGFGKYGSSSLGLTYSLIYKLPL